MTTKIWSNNNVLHLISFYRENECLWNIKSELYKRTDIKKKCYKELCQLFDDSEENIKKKFRNLRTAYTTERKKVLLSKKSGSSTDDVYKSHLFYFNEFLFLDATLVFRPTKNNVSFFILVIIN